MTLKLYSKTVSFVGIHGDEASGLHSARERQQSSQMRSSL